MPVTRRRRAEDDLIQIWLDIGADNPKAADRLLDELERRTMLIGQYPEIGRERPDIAEGLRYLVSDNYLILYRLIPTGVEVVRYINGRRDLKAMNF